MLKEIQKLFKVSELHYLPYLFFYKLSHLGSAFEVKVMKAAQSLSWDTDISVPMEFRSVVTYIPDIPISYVRLPTASPTASPGLFLKRYTRKFVDSLKA